MVVEVVVVVAVVVLMVVVVEDETVGMVAVRTAVAMATAAAMAAVARAADSGTAAMPVVWAAQSTRCSPCSQASCTASATIGSHADSGPGTTTIVLACGWAAQTRGGNMRHSLHMQPPRRTSHSVHTSSGKARR